MMLSMICRKATVTVKNQTNNPRLPAKKVVWSGPAMIAVGEVLTADWAKRA